MLEHHLAVAGFVLGALGALIFTYGAASILLGVRDYKGPSDATYHREKRAYAFGAGLIALAMLVELVSTIIR